MRHRMHDSQGTDAIDADAGASRKTTVRLILKCLPSKNQALVTLLQNVCGR